MRYLVTGGAGFIGSNLVKELLARGHFVRVLDNFTTGRRRNISPFLENSRFELVEGDLRSLHTVREAVRTMDFVLHQGALPSVPRSINDPLTTNDVNILGTLNILEAAREFQTRRVIFASSSSVYGNSPQLPKTEDMAVLPLSPYALSKYTAERYCQIYYALYGIETVSLRYFNVFGPNQDPDSQYSAIIPKCITLMRQGKPPVIYGDGTQSRDFTYVMNNIDAILLACEVRNIGGEVFNVACGHRVSLLELVEALNGILGTAIPPKFMEARNGEVKHSLASIEKIKNRLSFVPRVPFEEGLRLTIAAMSGESGT
jgi:nucleoside-diphosphate-sugar epimerase